MFQSGWKFVQDAYQIYTSYGIVQLLLISSCIIILISDKKNENLHLVYYCITALAIILFPPIAFVLGKYFIGSDVYWRVFWLIPSSIIIGLVGVKQIERISKCYQKKLFLLAFIMVLVLGGKNIFNSDNYTKSTNSYKLPQEVIELCEMVAPNGGNTKMVVPETIVSYIRQYNPNINLLYGRNLGKDTQKGKKYKILLQLNSSEPDTKYIAKYIKKKDCNYVVFDNSSIGIEEIEQYGYKLYGTTASYTVFKLVE